MVYSGGNLKEIAIRRSTRLFEIIQILRSAAQPMTAADLAAALEVSMRTVYRDIAALQAMRTPTRGRRGSATSCAKAMICRH